MEDDFLALFEAAKALVNFIDKEYVFDKAAAGGCSGMDYYQSDTFYDLIVDARRAISDVENGLEGSTADSEKKIQSQEARLRLFEASKLLATHVEKERAFDKVNDMGPVGVETYQSDALIETVKNANKAIADVENGLV